MTKVLAVLIISLIVLLIVIYYATKTDMTLPYLGVVVTCRSFSGDARI